MTHHQVQSCPVCSHGLELRLAPYFHYLAHYSQFVWYQHIAQNHTVPLLSSHALPLIFFAPPSLHLHLMFSLSYFWSCFILKLDVFQFYLKLILISALARSKCIDCNTIDICGLTNLIELDELKAQQSTKLKMQDK